MSAPAEALPKPRAASEITAAFLSNSLIYSAAGVVGNLLSYLMHAFFARHLSIADYGELQALMALYAILGGIAAGVGFFTIKRTAVYAQVNAQKENREALAGILRDLRRWLPIALAVFLASLPGLRSVFHIQSIGGLIGVGLAAAISVLTLVHDGNLKAWDRFRDSSLISVGNAFLRIGFVFLLAAVFRAEVVVVAVALALADLSAYVLARHLNQKALGRWEPVAPGGTGATLSFSTLAPTLLFSFAVLVAGAFDVLWVRVLTDANLSGRYAALSLLSKLVWGVNSTIISVALPAAFSEKGAPARVVGTAYGLIAATSLGAMALYALFPQLIVGICFGQQYLDAAGDLPLFAGIALSFSMMSLEANWCFARSRYEVSLILGVTILAAAVAMALFHQTIPQIAASLILSFVLGQLLFLYSRKRR